MSFTTRFAPSPTGFLHLGHAASALFAWERARPGGGRFLLRIEDIDPARCRADFTAALTEDLAWLGLLWDGPVRVQSEHFADYAAVLDALRCIVACALAGTLGARGVRGLDPMVRLCIRALAAG